MRSGGQSGVRWVGLIASAVLLSGCASKPKGGPTEAQQHFVAGQEEAFSMLQRSGIPLVRVLGPFERPVVQWQEGMTLSQVILTAGYLEVQDPSQILIQRGAQAFEIVPGRLLSGEDIPVESGDMIHVLP